MTDTTALEERVARLEASHREALSPMNVDAAGYSSRLRRDWLLLLCGLLAGLGCGAWVANGTRGPLAVIGDVERRTNERLDAFISDSLPEQVRALCGSEHLAALRRDTDEAATRALQNADTTQTIVAQLKEKLQDAQSQLDALRAQLANLSNQDELRVGKLIAREILVDTKLEAGEVALKNGRARLYSYTSVGGDGNSEEITMLSLSGPQTDAPNASPTASLAASQFTSGERRATLDLRTHYDADPRSMIILHAAHGGPTPTTSMARGVFQNQDFVTSISADLPEVTRHRR